MGQAFDSNGDPIGNQMMGDSMRDVLDKLKSVHGDKMAEARIRRFSSDDMGQAPMPTYRCHKWVWALQISEVRLDSDEARREGRETDGSATLCPAEYPYAPFRVDADYVRKHNPQPGGYFVQYADGYKSFSPAKAFEDGYTRLQ
jgi:hypothetical protein